MRPGDTRPGDLRLDGLAVGYRRGRRSRTVLTGLTATAAAGTLTALVGPNGTGKSTLLRTMAGLQPALAGAVAMDTADGPVDLAALTPVARARRLAVVLTERVDTGLLRAAEVVALGRYPHTDATGALRGADRAAVAAALAAVGAAELAGRRAAELSDGERQRVLVARALAQEPQLLLLDEPSAFLDVSARVALLGLLRRLARQRSIAVVLSSHDLELVLRVAGRVWLLDRSGVLHDATPAELIAAGTVGQVFDTDDLTFDPATATFTPRP